MKKVIESASLIYAALVFVGYAQLHVYYSHFKIPIWSYLNLGEVLLGFLPLTLALVASLVVWAAILILDDKPETLADFGKVFTARKKDPAGFVVPNTAEEKEPKWWSHFKALWKLATLILLVWFGYTVIRIFGEISGVDYWKDWREAQGHLLLWAMVLAILALTASGKGGKRVWLQLWGWGMGILGALAICVWSAKRARCIKSGKPEHTAVLFTTQGPIESSSCFYYIGRCEDVTFFWDTVSGEWTAIKNSGVIREDVMEVNEFPLPFE